MKFEEIQKWLEIAAKADGDRSEEEKLFVKTNTSNRPPVRIAPPVPNSDLSSTKTTSSESP